MSRTRVAVVGGGIIGTAVARQVSQSLHHPEVSLFEKEDRLAAHQTGHNSGVVHAGLYYEPGGLKARLCKRGGQMIKQFALERQVPYDECGKIVVALDESQSSRLEALHARSVANGVPGVRIIGPDEIREIEPHSRGCRALHSPHTAIVDYAALTNALADEFRGGGGAVWLEHEVTRIEERGQAVRLSAGDWADEFDLVITCAGLQSDRVARAAGDPADPRIIPFYGDYFLLTPAKTHLVKGLIYPVPDPRYPFLGVHVTKRIDGAVMLGPNAFLSMGREAYESWQCNVRDMRDTAGFPGLWRFASRNLPAAVRESRTAFSSRAFVSEVRKLVPDIDSADVERGPRGIRAQAMDVRGRLVDDFAISGTDRVVHVRNAPSPGATSAMAIAEHIVTEAFTRAGIRPSPGRSNDSQPF